MTKAEVEKLSLKAYKLKLKLDEKQGELKELNVSIQKYFDENPSVSEIKVSFSDAEAGGITLKKSERMTSLVYDVDKLKKKLGQDLFFEVIEKSYSINNINELIELMRSHKIKSEDFKKLITVNVTVNKDAIKQLYEVGEIKMEALNGTYTANVSKSITIKAFK